MLGYFSEKLTKEYDYFLLPDGFADVFIYDLESIKEVIHEENENQASFIEYQYNMNQFHVDASIVTEQMVSDNPQRYINYVSESEKTLEEKVTELQQQNDDLIQCLLEMSEFVYQ